MVFWSGFRRWEKETAPIILDNIRRSRCFMDVGANCGIYTVLGAVINPGLRVVAIEPVPKICTALTHNVAQNSLHPRVTILNVAAGHSRDNSIYRAVRYDYAGTKEPLKAGQEDLDLTRKFLSKVKNSAANNLNS